MAFTAKITDIIAADTTGLLACHDSWKRVPLCDVAGILNGAPFDAALFNTTSGTPLARIRDVLGGTTSTYYTGDFDDAYLLEQGDLLIGMDGDFNIGYWGAQRALLNQRVCKLTANPDHYDKKLLGFVLPGYLAAINANTPSITVKHLSSRTVGEIELPLPPRAEQTRIVEKLEELLGGLDAAVGELKAAQRKLTHYHQSLLKAAMEGALTAQWRAARETPGSSSPRKRGSKDVQRETKKSMDSPFRGNDGIGETGPDPGSSPGQALLNRILQERRTRWEEKQQAKFAQTGKPPPKGWQTKYLEPVAPDTTELPALPEGWVWATIDQLSFVVRGASPRPAGDPRFFGGEIPWITVGSLTADETMHLDSVEQFVTPAGRDASRYIEPNTLLLTNSGATLGVPKITRIGGCINDGSVALLDVEQPMQTYLYWFLRTQTKRLRAMNQGAAQPNLNTDIVRNICVPLCGLAEMFQINETLEKSVDAISAQETAISHSLHHAAAQRRNLLRAAFSGQLVQQDPNDEPASELLARIRAAKADNVGTGKRTSGRTRRQ